jgi:hypothetical protein
MEEAIIARLLATSGISSLVSTRVYPGAVPQGSAMPAMVVNTITGAPIYADEGEVGLDQARMQIDCWATTYAGAKLLAREVRESLSGFEGASGGVTFPYILLETTRDSREGGANTSEYRYRTSMDFIIWSES